MTNTSPKKRLIICCDGTWQTPNQEYPTNVVKIAQAIASTDKDNIPQIIYYRSGLGSDNKRNLIPGALGYGIHQEIQDAYIFIAMNYEPGTEIYLFGFSRGAYTVRCLAGFIFNSGLLGKEKLTSKLHRTNKLEEKFGCKPGTDECEDDDDLGRYKELCNKSETLLNVAYAIYRNEKIRPDSKVASFFRELYKSPQIDIHFLGCWDTVGSLGIPHSLPFSKCINKALDFHDLKLSSIIKHARHALALHEIREAFDATRMFVKKETTDLKQVWFAGDHGCVGGGSHNVIDKSHDVSFPALTLKWMIDEARAFGLSFETSDLEDITIPDITQGIDYKRGCNWYISALAGIRSRDISEVLGCFLKKPRTRRVDFKNRLTQFNDKFEQKNTLLVQIISPIIKILQTMRSIMEFLTNTKKSAVNYETHETREEMHESVESLV